MDDPRVEAAAKAFWDSNKHPLVCQFEDAHPIVQDAYRKNITAALSAADKADAAAGIKRVPITATREMIAAAVHTGEDGSDDPTDYEAESIWDNMIGAAP